MSRAGRYLYETELSASLAREEGGQYALDWEEAFPQYEELVFTHGVGLTAFDSEPTWHAILENGFARQPSARKDPQYVTHGLHPYKGKFYPQLAKGLMNVCALRAGARVFDPFCGSGTTLLEGYLNGQRTLGCDINPLRPSG